MIPDLRFYLSMVLRRLPIVLAATGLSTTLALLYAFSLPPLFRAESRLLIESAQIPDELAASTVRSTADELLLAIRQRILTRDNLTELAATFSVYEEDLKNTPEFIVRDMSERVAIFMPSIQGGTGVVTVSFAASDPELSAQVTNAIAEQVLEWNVELRTKASGNTLAFFEQEVKRLTTELSQVNADILEFEQTNRDALPESLEFRRTRQAAQQERLLQVDRELAGLRDRRQRLTELYDRTGRLVMSSERGSPEQQQLETLRQELASALVVLSPTNPRVRALQLQVTALEEAVKEQLGSEGTGEMSAFEVQMMDIDGQIQFLAEQKALIEADLSDLQTTIEATPANSIRLAELQNNYETLRVQYDQAVTSLSNARIGDRIEITDRGQRISVIENAVPPAFRAEPNRKLIAAAGFGAGAMLSVAVLILLEFLNQTVRRPSELSRVIGAAPFGVVPFIETGSGGLRPGTVAMVLLAFMAVLLPMALLLLHMYVTPIDSLLGLAVPPEAP
jgi:polysaccharide biosynthesis transport protein